VKQVGRCSASRTWGGGLKPLPGLKEKTARVSIGGEKNRTTMDEKYKSFHKNEGSLNKAQHAGGMWGPKAEKAKASNWKGPKGNADVLEYQVTKS